MRLFITGATGLIGRRLVVDRLERGDHLVLLSRNRRRAASMFAAGVNPRVEVVGGNPAAPGVWQDAVDGCDGVVHLAGAGIADRRWSPAYKRVLVDSRIDSTHQVVEAIARASSRPGVLVNASAVGWYGDTADRETDEGAPHATDDFLADLAVQWEREARKAEEAGTRVVMLRTGVVLDRRGGLLGRLVPPFRLCLGGPIGSGRQYVPWIHWRDLVALIDLALRDPEVHGPLNGTAPNPVTNREFSQALAEALRRPCILPVPAFALRLALGEFARYALMSQRIVPGRALAAGHRFLHPAVGRALREILAGPERDGDAESVAAAPRDDASAPLAAGGPPAPVRLLAISIDGVLLRRDGHLAKGTQRACRAARQAGCVLVLATARAPRSTRPIVEALELSAPLITYNGALIWNPVDDRPQYHEPMDGPLAAEVVETARAVDPEILVGLEVIDRWFTDRIDPDLLPRSARAIEPDDVGPLDRYLAAPVTQLNLYGRPKRVARVRAEISRRFWEHGRVSLFQPEAALLQVMHPLADKAIALQRIARKLGATADEVMAIGGGINDTGMIGWVEFGVAVGNAAPEVKVLANVIVDSCDEQGVSRAIKRYVLT